MRTKGTPPHDGASSKAIAIHVGMTLREVEKIMIEATLRQNWGNVSRSAHMLGIDRSTLYNKLKEYQLAR